MTAFDGVRHRGIGDPRLIGRVDRNCLFPRFVGPLEALRHQRPIGGPRAHSIARSWQPYAVPLGTIVTNGQLNLQAASTEIGRICRGCCLEKGKNTRTVHANRVHRD
jgi:hypothetical protein